MVRSPVMDEAHEAPTRTGLDRLFDINGRGSTVLTELRGGLVTFVTMAYIIILNPIILASGHDKFGHHLSVSQLATSTIVVAAVMTFLMGVVGDMPFALAAGLGLNGVMAFVIAPTMTWPDAMGLAVIDGLLICVFAATGLRRRMFNAVPMALKKAIAVGIGLFIGFIGLVETGITTPGAGTPVQLGAGGTLKGWPVFLALFAMMLMFVLRVLNVKGAILIGMVVSTLLSLLLHAVGVTGKQWGLIEPKMPHSIVSAPDFGLIGHFSLFGAFGAVTAITAVVFIFTLFLSDMFDAMGTITGLSDEAGLLDAQGQVPRFGRVLFIDGLAAAAGGAGSSSPATSFVEAAAGIGEGARTGLAAAFTGVLFAICLFFNPLYSVVPQQVAGAALIVVAFYMVTQVVAIPWNDWGIAVPAFLTITFMPFTYSITNGIGMGLISYAVIRTAQGRIRDVNVFVWVVAILFAIYFAIHPIEQLLGIA